MKELHILYALVRIVSIHIQNVYTIQMLPMDIRVQPSTR